MPVTPQKIQIKTPNRNASISLINGQEINILKAAGLQEISFELLLPQVKYPFASYEGSFKRAEYFLTHLEEYRDANSRFRFVLSRVSPAGRLLFDTNMTVTIEDFEVVEDALSAPDIILKLRLKQWRDYGTKKLSLRKGEDGVYAVAQSLPREQEAVSTSAAQTHTVTRGDCLYNIAKKYYGDGSRYTSIYSANSQLIDTANAAYGNPKYTIYPGQVLTVPAV